jgi:hypothetical protein
MFVDAAGRDENGVREGRREANNRACEEVRSSIFTTRTVARSIWHLQRDQGELLLPGSDQIGGTDCRTQAAGSEGSDKSNHLGSAQCLSRLAM